MDLISLIESTAKEISSNKDSNALRNLEKELWVYEANDNHMLNNHLAYFMKTLLEKYFLNLAADVPYLGDESRRVQLEFLDTLAKQLMCLVKSIRENDLELQISSYAEIGNAYMLSVHELNTIYKQSNFGNGLTK